MDHSSFIKTLQDTLPALQKQIEAARAKAERQQDKLNQLLERRGHTLKLLESHGIAVLPPGEGQAAVSQTGDLLDPTTRRGAAESRSFRDTIRSVLSRSAEPMRPPEVARELEAMNYPYNAATPLATRMANELNRMSKAGSVEKIGQTYRLPGEGAS